MPIPNRYQFAVEKAIATYDFFDIAEGTGIVELDAFNVAASAAITYSLGKGIDVYSYNKVTHSGAISNAAPFAAIQTIDWDLSAFNFPKVIKGTAYLNGQFGVESSAGTGAIGYAHFYIYHYDGSTATELGNARTENITAPSAGDATSIFSLKISLTEKKFNPNDILRLTCTLYAHKTGASNNSNICIGNDPQNRVETDTLTAVPTTLKVWIPFKLDL